MSNRPTSVEITGRRERLKTLGVAVMAAGMISAALLYRIRAGAQNPAADSWDTASSKPEQRQMGIMYGKTGVIISDLAEDLKRPGTQAALVVVFAGAGAAMCFYLARGPRE